MNTPVFAQIQGLLDSLKTHKRAVITSGMPYSNGVLHIGHMAGAFVPSDIYARWLRIILGKDNVIYVTGSDDHGAKSQISANIDGRDLNDFIQEIRKQHMQTLKAYQISCDRYGSTSETKHFADHTHICQTFIENLHAANLLFTKSTEQWFDPQMQMFLPDHMVKGECPLCGATGAHSQECDSCGGTYAAKELKNPRSTVSTATPILKSTRHIWLDMWKLASQCYEHIPHAIKQKSAKKDMLAEIAPVLSIDEVDLATIRDALPPFKRRAQKHGKLQLAFSSYDHLHTACKLCEDKAISFEIPNSWAYRSITRDTTWGIPIQEGLGLSAEERKSKSLYVWPESLIAPLSFTYIALKEKQRKEEEYLSFWYSPDTRIHQFLGIDNLYFYGVMQTAMFLGNRLSPKRKLKDSNIQMSELHTSYHLLSQGKKMSKSTGNFYTADEILQSGEFSSDQVRYYLAFLSLRDKPADFDLKHLKERNAFLTGPLNAAFEKPISACHSKFSSKVPEGTLLEKATSATLKVIRQYVKCMPQAKYPTFLLALENYARTINSLFATHKPHDDRYPLKDREDALYSCFYILKNLVILLHPFAPQTMETLRESLNLPEDIYTLDELAKPMPQRHNIGKLQKYF